MFRFLRIITIEGPCSNSITFTNVPIRNAIFSTDVSSAHSESKKIVVQNKHKQAAKIAKIWMVVFSPLSMLFSDLIIF